MILKKIKIKLMNKMKIIKLILKIVLLIIVSVALFRFFTAETDLLENYKGYTSIQHKYDALVSMYRKDINHNNKAEIISVLVKDIDNFEEAKSYWHKGGWTPLAYAVNLVLKKYTEKDFGDFEWENEEEWPEIAEKWKRWYEEEYVTSQTEGS